MTHNTTRREIEDRVAADPFVLHDVVKAELLEVAPSKTDPRLPTNQGEARGEHDVVQAGDLALHTTDWKMTGQAADGTAMSGRDPDALTH